MDPRPVFLPLTFEHLSVTPDDLDLCLAVLIRGTVNRPVVEKTGAGALRFYESLPDETIPGAGPQRAPGGNNPENKTKPSTGHRLRHRCRQEATPALAFELVLLLQAGGQPAGLFYLLGEANEFGAALLSSPGTSFLKTLEAIEKGSVTALILVECDPFRLFPDRARLEQALEKLDFLLVMDFLPSPCGPTGQIFFYPPKLYLRPEDFSSIRKAGFNGRHRFTTAVPRSNNSAPEAIRRALPAGYPRRGAPAGRLDPG